VSSEGSTRALLAFRPPRALTRETIASSSSPTIGWWVVLEANDRGSGRRAASRTAYRSPREQWQAEYLRHLRISDAAVVCAAFGVADGVRF
jgi:hypothetical protein